MAYIFCNTVFELTLISLVRRDTLAYNNNQQHPPRLSTMRTMGGYFFLGAEK